MEPILILDRSETYKKPNTAVLLMEYSNKITPNDCYSAMLIGECFVQPSSKKLLPATMETKAKTDYVQKVRSHEMLISRRDVSIISFPSWSRECVYVTTIISLHVIIWRLVIQRQSDKGVLLGSQESNSSRNSGTHGGP